MDADKLIREAGDWYEREYTKHYNWLDANAGFIRDGVINAIASFAKHHNEALVSELRAEREKSQKYWKALQSYSDPSNWHYEDGGCVHRDTKEV